MAEPVQISQGFPQNIVKRSDDGGYDFDLQLYCHESYAVAEPLFPAISAAETTWGLIADSYVLSRKIASRQEGGFMTICDLHCGTESPVWIASMEDGGLQKPLEFSANYRTKWNYHLAMVEGTSAYANYNTATTPELSDANALLMKWVKEPSEAPIIGNKPWKVKTGFTKTKPGVDSFVSPSPVIRETKRFYSESRAFGSSLTFAVGTVYDRTDRIYIPGKTWLVMASGYSFDGLYWNNTVVYQGASSWDSDLYGAVIERS